VDVYRDDALLQIPVNIGSLENENGEDVGVMGISFGTQRSISQSFLKGVYETYNLSIKTIQFIGKMLSGNMGTENLSGPIGIAQMAGDTAKAGLLPFMYLMALLSISLGVLNLLPIPVLDGGQLTLLGIEALRGKPLTERTENFVYTGGALIVGALMIFAVFNDVSRFF
jgi:regulator of sigma E protease